MKTGVFGIYDVPGKHWIVDDSHAIRFGPECVMQAEFRRIRDDLHSAAGLVIAEFDTFGQPVLEDRVMEARAEATT